MAALHTRKQTHHLANSLGREGQGRTGRGRFSGIVCEEGRYGSVHLFLRAVRLLKSEQSHQSTGRDRLVRTPASGDQQARLALEPKQSLSAFLPSLAVNHTAHACDSNPSLPQLSSKACSCVQTDICFLLRPSFLCSLGPVFSVRGLIRCSLIYQQL